MRLIDLVALVLLSGLLTGLIRMYALRVSLVDVPNDRSSHAVSTPRGGGLAIALVALTALGVFTLKSSGPLGAWGILVGATAIAVVSFLDDHTDLPAAWRILVHFSAAAVCVWSLGAPMSLNLFGHTLYLGMVGPVLAVLTLVWFTNLYNFMDGIDGIAGIQAISVLMSLAMLLAIFSPGSPWQTWSMVLATSTLGFLFWNFPTARIFMGDCGSAFLGFSLGALMLATEHVNEKYLWAILILMAVFITDATLTLIRRFLRGEKVYLAHRSHAFQHAAQMHQSHQKVSIAIGIINILWLAPLAGIVMTQALSGTLGMTIAYTPIVLLCIYYQAGAKTLSRQSLFDKATK